jgi:hypothetical protein
MRELSSLITLTGHFIFCLRLQQQQGHVEEIIRIYESVSTSSRVVYKNDTFSCAFQKWKSYTWRYELKFIFTASN